MKAMIPKHPLLKSKKLRDSAKGQSCQIRIPGSCKDDIETTVLAHLNGGGMGIKKSDFQASFCCFACHQVVDGAKNKYSRELVELWHRQGVERTQNWWFENGYLQVK